MKLLFVCIGNTCRSPMAESVMAHYSQQHGLNWQTDSAGLRSWNVGYAPEERCIQMLAEHGLSTQHVGREISPADFAQCDYIFGMDAWNMEELQQLASKAGVDCKAKIRLLGSYIGREEDAIIEDPYFSNGIALFRAVYAQIDESCRNFVQEHK